MEGKSIFREYLRPILFTLLVIAAGSGALYQEGYFTKSQAINPMIFGDMAIKVVFEDETPELLAYVPADRLSSVPTLIGEPVPEEDSMVLGYAEAKDMAEENNITISQALWGYDVDEGFLGDSIRVTGMLKRTDTLMDMMHILPKGRFDSIQPAERITVKFTDEKMPKFFYYIRPDGTNIPRGIRFAMGGMMDYERLKNEKTVVSLDILGLDLHIRQNKTYLPLIIGSEEAKMMMGEKLFAKTGDKIEGFFGKDVVIAGVLAPTGTVLDMFHYMPEE